MTHPPCNLWPTHIECGCPRCLGELLRGVLQQELAPIMASLNETLQLIRSNTTILQGLDTLLDGLRDQVAQVLAGTVIPAPVQEKIDAIFAEAQLQGAQLAQVLTENTPAAGTP